MRITQADRFLVMASENQFPRDGLPHIAFAGRSNVGKSSLINALTQRKKLAHTSNTPGKTRQVIFYRLNNAFHFVDLPGYGYAQVSLKERARFKVLVDSFMQGNPDLKACILLLDPRRTVGNEEISFLHYLQEAAIPALVVFTKWDRVRSSKRAAMERSRKLEFAGAARKILFTSAKDKTNLPAVWDFITPFLNSAD